MQRVPFERIDLPKKPPPAGVVLNRVVLACNDCDRGGLHVKSNIDSTHKLDSRTFEDIAFTDRDLVVIQNKLDRPVAMLLEGLQLPDGRRAVIKPSRQRTYRLVDRSVSTVHSTVDLTLGPGESLVVHSSEWVPDKGVGARVPI